MRVRPSRDPFSLRPRPWRDDAARRAFLCSAAAAPLVPPHDMVAGTTHRHAPEACDGQDLAGRSVVQLSLLFRGRGLPNPNLLRSTCQRTCPADRIHPVDGEMHGKISECTRAAVSAAKETKMPRRRKRRKTPRRRERRKRVASRAPEVVALALTSKESSLGVRGVCRRRAERRHGHSCVG